MHELSMVVGISLRTVTLPVLLSFVSVVWVRSMITTRCIQKDLADGKKTMRAYLWKICGEAYDQEHQG